MSPKGSKRADKCSAGLGIDEVILAIPPQIVQRENVIRDLTPVPTRRLSETPPFACRARYCPRKKQASSNTDAPQDLVTGAPRNLAMIHRAADTNILSISTPLRMASAARTDHSVHGTVVP